MNINGLNIIHEKTFCTQSVYNFWNKYKILEKKSQDPQDVGKYLYDKLQEVEKNAKITQWHHFHNALCKKTLEEGKEIGEKHSAEMDNIQNIRNKLTSQLLHFHKCVTVYKKEALPSAEFVTTNGLVSPLMLKETLQIIRLSSNADKMPTKRPQNAHQKAAEKPPFPIMGG